MGDHFFDIRTDKLYKRIAFFILFGVLLNLLLFFGTSHLENKITNRSFINSYVIYCTFLGLFHCCVYRKFIRNFLTMTIVFFFIRRHARTCKTNNHITSSNVLIGYKF